MMDKQVKVFIKENSWIARIAAIKLKSGKLAIVFGNTICLHNTSRQEFLNDTEWVCHELKHVEQYNRHGRLPFIFKYIFDWIKNGYYNNKFEIEARKNEKDKGLMTNVIFV